MCINLMISFPFHQVLDGKEAVENREHVIVAEFVDR